ncbi:uncharacterized protein ARMOST_22413 [Armillaria ostoyae]|uniref:Retrotransposon gag domain-containing protein n=1 Tax=Armillaria ostoyae TaxID=47428 RepID=A0A284SCS6_ARMOS|nr:uncharacterized protein ARMOST_22413 [Armillaria ostoyae]
MSFPTSNPDHSWNQWARSMPPPPRDGRPMSTLPRMNTFPLATQPLAHQMFQEPPLPPMTPPRPRNTAGSFSLSSALLCPTYPSSQFPTVPRPPSGPYSQNPTIQPRARRPPSTIHPFQEASLLEVSLSTSPPTSAPSPTQTANPTPPIMEETNQSTNERLTILSTPTAPITSGQNSTPSTEPSSVLTDPRHGRSDASTSSSEADTRDWRTESGWHTTSQSPEGPQSLDGGETQQFEREYMPTVLRRNTLQQQEARYVTHVPELMRSSVPSPTYSSLWRWQRETALTSMAPPDFDNFNQDQETFGWGDDEEEEDALEYGDYRGYTSAPHFYHQPFPLPDSPTYAGDYQENPPHACRIQQYRPPQYGQYRLGGSGPDDPIPGESGDIPPETSQPSNQERLDAARRQSKTNRREYDVLKAQMEAAQAKMASYDATWDFNQPPAPSKGKELDRGRPPIPNYRRPLYDQSDRWSVPQPPPKWQAPDPYPAPIGTAPNEAPWLGVKPVMVKPPLPFEGKYDNVERFVGDCFTYFEVFAAYFQVPSSRVVFAVTHLEGPAKDWWVHAQQDFWCNDENDTVAPRFQFPSWGEFTTLLAQNFHDPASEELHEKRMFDLRMSSLVC